MKIRTAAMVVATATETRLVRIFISKRSESWRRPQICLQLSLVDGLVYPGFLVEL